MWSIIESMNSVLGGKAKIGVLAVLFIGALFLVAALANGGNTPPFTSVEIGIATLSPLGESGGRAIPASAASCVTGDTHIATPSGDVPIKELREGDIIYSTDLKGSTIETKVVQMFVHDGVHDPLQDYDRWPLLELTFDGGESLRITENHPVYSMTELRWKNIGMFSVGEQLLSQNLGVREIVSIEILSDRPIVYNLVTDHETHNYFANGVLVHNGDESVILAGGPAGSTSGGGSSSSGSGSSGTGGKSSSGEGSSSGTGKASSSGSGSGSGSGSSSGSSSTSSSSSSGSGSSSTSSSGGPPPPECSDGVDNDGDGVVDEEDPGCHTDGTPGGSSSGGGSSSSGSGTSSGGSSSGGGDSYNPNIDDEDDLVILASPRIVRSGDSSTISWLASGSPSSCVVSGPGVSSTVVVGSADTGPLTEESFYTFSCDYGTYQKNASARVIILPVFEEF